MFSNLPKSSKIALQLVFVLVIVAIIVTVLTSLGLSMRKTGSQIVHLQVEASGGFSIITVRAGKTLTITKATTVTVPWSRTVTIPSGTEVYLTASNPSQTGKLSCSLSLGSIPWKYATTTAPKDGVACAGIVP